MTVLHPRTFFLNEQETTTEWGPQYTDEDLDFFRASVVIDTQWYILVSFKSNISKNEVHELGDSRHTLSMYCGRYIRITSENTQVHLSKIIGHNEWI